MEGNHMIKRNDSKKEKNRRKKGIRKITKNKGKLSIFF